MQKRLLISCLIFFQFTGAQKISSLEDKISDIYVKSLTEGKSYNWLEHLSKNIEGVYLVHNAQRAIDWAKDELNKITALDSIWLQPVMVPNWVRGTFNMPTLVWSGNTINVNVYFLGGSITQLVEFVPM